MSKGIKEIARAAGVSNATVSRVINDRGNVNEETRKRVEAVIKEFDYYPNARAQAFSTQKTMTIGAVLTGDAASVFSNPYYSDLLAGVFSESRKHGYHVMMTYIDHDDSLALVRKKMVDGLVILTPGKKDKGAVEALMNTGVPVVSTSKLIGLPQLHCVAVDEYEASCKVMEYLVSLGHKKIAIICGPADLYSTYSRLRGYRAVLEKHGMEYDKNLVRYGDSLVESGLVCMRELLKDNHGISAVFACSDMMAIGARRAIEETGKNVPGDISLVSTDATSVAEYLDMGLTTIQQPTFERGRLCTEHLIRMIDGEDPGNSVLLHMDISIKKSTGYLSADT